MVDKLESIAEVEASFDRARAYLRSEGWPDDHGAIGYMAVTALLAGYERRSATPANGEQVEPDKLKTAYLALLTISQEDDGPLGRYAAKIAKSVEPAATFSTPTEDARDRVKVRPFSEWHEDHGDVLWWKLPIMESPYCGSPLDLGRSMKVTVQIGFEEHEMPIAHTGGWPFSKEDESDLWWSPLPSPTFFRTAFGNKGTDRHG